MPTAFITHSDCLEHVTPPGHPEQVARLSAILQAMEAPEFAQLIRLNAPLAADDDLARAHPARYIQSIRDASPDQGWRSLDADTHLSPGSVQAAYRAAGGAVRAVDAVLGGQVRNAFAALRPPGHHAERETAMGFCLFGNVAVAAKHALDHHGLSRVAILDFDVHHGNGTQDLIEEDARIFFASSHQMPLYPGTGAADETGAHANVLNLPLPEGCTGAQFLSAWSAEILPKIQDFAPELILVSAGFDAHRADPLAGLNVETADFAALTRLICDLADRICAGKLVFCLEGGYDLTALAASVAACITVLMEYGA
jgi:acetoin utilization deacetylase AcuC-like enzyme